VARNVREQDAGARPAIAGTLPDVTPYDTILLGSPVWNVQTPMIMRTFIDSVDLTGKEIRGFSIVTVSTQCAPEGTRTPNLLIRRPDGHGHYAHDLAAHEARCTHPCTHSHLRVTIDSGSPARRAERIR